MTRRGLGRFLDDMIRQRRPRRFRAGPADAAPLRAAITLRAAQPDGDVPREEFVEQLHRRLAAQQAEGRGDESVPVHRPASRRAFVRVTSLAAGSAAAGAGLVRVLDDGSGGGGRGTSPATAAPAPVLTPETGVWRTVATTHDLPEGGVRPFDLDTIVGFVERAGGRVRAVSGVCTHQGCRLALDPAERQLRCPCHRTVFAVTGEVVRSQLPTPPQTLPELVVREVDGVVQVFAPPRPA
ncbi:MAG: Rieske (2Fe-2S) protein [Frankia sp.]